MTDGDLMAKCTPASPEAARAVSTVVSALFAERGWVVALYGSTVHGEGRDIDLLMAANGDGPGDVDEVERRLHIAGFNVLVRETKGRMVGLVGTFHGFILDITLVP